MERRSPNGASPEDRGEYLLQRVLEYRQGQVEHELAALADALHGKEGIKEQLMILRILADQRHRATLCIGKWITGVLAVLFAALCFWVVTESMQTRDAVKHLLTRPPGQQQGQHSPSP